MWNLKRPGLRVDLRPVRLVPFALQIGSKPPEIVPMNPKDQYGLQIRLWNPSRTALSQQAFEGLPLRIDCGADTHIVAMASSMCPPLNWEPGARTASHDPADVPAGASWYWLLHIIGALPDPTVWSPVEPTKVTSHPSKDVPAAITLGIDTYGFRV